MNSTTKRSSLARDSAPSTISPKGSYNPIANAGGPAASNAEPNPSLGMRTAPSTETSQQLNIRSCITCRRRKVRCDKQRPCSNCVKARVECIFPGPGRAPRKSKKSPDRELLARLRRLEGVVQSLSVQVVNNDVIPGAPNTISP